MSGNVGGMPFANVFHCHTDDPGITTSAGVLDFITAFKNALSGTTLLANFSNTLHVTQFQGIVQLDADHAVESQLTASLDGGSSTTALPANECIVLSWLTSAYWRGGKPRTYLPGLTTSFIDTNHSLADSFKSSVLTQAKAFRTAVNAITTAAVDETRMGFLSYASNKVWRPTPLFIAFDDVTIHDRLGTQRRRLGAWLR